MRILIGAWELGDWSSDDPVVLAIGDRFDRGVADFRSEPMDAEQHAALGGTLFDSIDAHTYNNARGPWRSLCGPIVAILAVLRPTDRDRAAPPWDTLDVLTTADERACGASDFIVDVDPEPDDQAS